jgi:hypothetical protein
MSCVYSGNGFYYYKGYGQCFSLKTRDKRDAQLLKKEYDRRYALEEARGDIIHKPKKYMYKTIMDEYLEFKKQNYSPMTHRTDKQLLN